MFFIVHLVSVILPKPKNDGAIDVDEKAAAKQAPRMTFKMLARDPKGRLETRQLMVPETAQMCVNLAKAEVNECVLCVYVFVSYSVVQYSIGRCFVAGIPSSISLLLMLLMLLLLLL